jgi:heptosyltransferase III
VIRYAGQPLPDRPRIAVLANDAIGNFVMATPLLRLLRGERAPSELLYFGGKRTWELQAASDLAHWSFPLLGSRPDEALEMARQAGNLDFVLNLESSPFAKTFAYMLCSSQTLVAGPCAGPGGRGELPYADDERGRLWADRDWPSADLTKRFPFLRSGFISEIFARLAYLEGDLPPYEVPSADPGRSVSDVLIATAASLPEKLWPVSHWREAVRAIRSKGLTVGLLGAPRKQQAEHWKGASDEDALVGDELAEDLRGIWTLPQVVGALALARAVLTLDNGILHLAVAAGAPTVGLFRHGIHRLWAPPFDRLDVLSAGEGRAVGEIEPARALEALGRRLGEAS